MTTPTIGKLTKSQRTDVLAALAALGPERLARLDGQAIDVAPGDPRYSAIYLDKYGYCLIGRALADATKAPMIGWQLELLNLEDDTPAANGIALLSEMSDAGRFRTTASVRALLALASAPAARAGGGGA